MKAIVHERYGGPDVLELQEIEKPELKEDGVLVRVRATSVNRGDWYGMTGTPYAGRLMMGLRKPKGTGIGWDFAGTVDEVGSAVTDLQPGDEVYGGSINTFAEYVLSTKAARMPENLSFEEAAAVPVAALTALQGLRDKGGLEPGQKVLINGASGGVGTFAVQIAKALGAEVTAVCSTRNVDLVRSLGADEVIDYTREDFTRSGRQYDLILDIAGSKSWWACRRVLAPRGTLVIVGASKGKGGFLGPLGHVVKMRGASIGSKRRAIFFIANTNKADLAVLNELIESGKVKPVVEKRYDLAETADALRYMGTGHVQGKLVITVGSG